MSDGHDTPFPSGDFNDPFEDPQADPSPEAVAPAADDGLESEIDDTQEAKFLQAVATAGVYHIDAYAFLQEGLEFTVRRAHGEKRENHTHVTGQQLCEGLKDLALQKYGLMAGIVLQRWNITSTIDFGNMVYALISAGLLAKTDQDSLEDFRNVFDLRRALCATSTPAKPTPANS
jgi:uncharacterized repeat protein (TIGR04138 family)